MYIKNDVYWPHSSQSTYDLYGAITLSKIFSTKTIGHKVRKSESAPKGKLRNFYGKETNAAVARMVYFTYMMLVLKDVIDGHIVKFGFTKASPIVHVGYLTGKTADRVIRESYYDKELNLREFDYGIPQIFLSSKVLGNKVIRPPRPLNKVFLKKLKAGFKYVKVKNLWS